MARHQGMETIFSRSLGASQSKGDAPPRTSAKPCKHSGIICKGLGRMGKRGRTHQRRVTQTFARGQRRGQEDVHRCSQLKDKRVRASTIRQSIKFFQIRTQSKVQLILYLQALRHPRLWHSLMSSVERTLLLWKVLVNGNADIFVLHVDVYQIP